MIIVNHGLLQLLVTTCTLVVVVFSSNTTEWANKDSSQSSKSQGNGERTHEKTVAAVTKSHRRAPRFDTAESSPWVRVYNRPPGTRDSFYNYETRGNTSAHTSGEVWDAYLDDASEEVAVPIKRSDLKVKDILRVKPKAKETPPTDVFTKSKNVTEIAPTSTPSTTKYAGDPLTTYPPAKKDSQKKEYIVWSSNEGIANSRVTVDSTTPAQDKNTVEEAISKNPNHWKVVGDGGEEGWQVVDDKGEVEWKIEYDDGEWRVISTGDVPADVEWIDPEYVWGPSDASVADDREYNSWPADDYRTPSNWKDPEAFLRGINNESWPQKESSEQDKLDERSRKGWKTDEPIFRNEKTQYGARQKIPAKSPPVAIVEERTNTGISEENSVDATVEEKPQNDQRISTGKTWVPESINRNEQKWVQGYGSRTWEGDNTGWNAESGGETWVTKNKQFASDPWIPKVPGSKSTPQKSTEEESDTNAQDNSVRAWGTGYGSKTWKGNEWNSNVVWKTGFNSGLPWAADNSTWKFPEQSRDKKPEVWSQPIPNYVESTGATKTTPSPTKRVDVVRVKWPTKLANKEDGFRKSPPSRRIESESDSWADDDSIGGVVWKIRDSKDPGPVEEPPKSNDDSSGWKISFPGEQQKPIAIRKNNPPSKTSNLISTAWKIAGNPPDSSAITWNQGQWPDVSIEPTWIFRGCKLTLKCGSDDATNDNSDQSNLPDTSDDDSIMPAPTTTPTPVNIGKVWPPRPSKTKGKSWRPPSKSWRPPKWKQPSPAPTSPETPSPPTMTWKPSPSPMTSYKKPTTPPDTWKQPPSTIMWVETTTTLPDMSWKPPPPPMKWKKGPRPTKSWKPSPTKSWRPPKRPNKTWQPSIATPPPDMWPTTKEPPCKNTTDATQAPQQSDDDDDDLIEPPQIIIITKLPKGSMPGENDKNNRDDTNRKPPYGPWIFPPRQNVPKSSSNRKDRNTPTGPKGPQNRPSRNNYRPPYRMKGWPKGMLPPKFSWPNNAMRRWTTRKPQSSAWKSKYSKSRTWRQMLKKLINGW